MPEYTYIAQTDAGSIQRGQIQAETKSDAQIQVSDQGWRLIGIQERTGAGARVVRRRNITRLPRFVSIRSAEIELFLQQLSVMLESGLSLAPSLRELSIHSPKKRLRVLSARLADKVEQGASFTSAIEESESFPLIVARLARIGEESGELSVTLVRAAEFMEKRRQAFATLLSTLAYPMFVAVAAGSVAVYLVGWAIPKLALFLDAMGRKLPNMTQSLLDLAAVTQAHGPRIAIGISVGMVALVCCYCWKPGRYRMDQLLLRLPILGRLLQMSETQQLARSLSLLMRNGVVLQEALGTVAMLHRNRYLAAEVIRSRQQVSAGYDLSTAIRGSGFAPLLPSMIAVGEQTGDLPKTLDHVGDYYTKRVDAQLKKFGKLIEPTIIVVVGGMVGYVYIAFFMALMSAGGNF